MATASKTKAAPKTEPSSWDKYIRMCDRMEETPDLDVSGLPDTVAENIQLMCTDWKGLENEMLDLASDGRSFLRSAEANLLTLSVFGQMKAEMDALEEQDDLPNNIERDPVGYFVEKYGSILWSRRKKAGFFKGQDDWTSVQQTHLEVQSWFGLA